MFGMCAHTRDANERKKFFEKARFVLGNIVLQFVHEKRGLSNRRHPKCVPKLR